MRIVLVLALLARATTADAAVHLYPRVVMEAGYPTIVIAAYNPDSQPALVCGSERHCLTFEVKTAKGAWVSRAALSAPPADPGVDFLVVDPRSTRDVMSLPVRPGAKARDFVVGAAHHIADLPPTTDYRFTYALDATAAAAAADHEVVRGPLSSSSSPMTLRTLENADILAAIQAADGAPDEHVKPGDDALLPSLELLAGNAVYVTAALAIRAIGNIHTPAAAALLGKLLGTVKNFQLRGEIARELDGLGDAALLSPLLASESDAFVAGALALALGTAGDQAAVPALRSARAARDQAVDRERPTFAETYPFDLALARLGDAASVKRLVRYLKAKDTDLVAQFRELGYTQNLTIGRAIGGFLGDSRRGPQSGSHRRVVPDEQAIRIGDYALFTLRSMFPARAPHVATSPLRRYSKQEVAAVKAALKRA